MNTAPLNPTDPQSIYQRAASLAVPPLTRAQSQRFLDAVDDSTVYKLAGFISSRAERDPSVAKAIRDFCEANRIGLNSEVAK